MNSYMGGNLQASERSNMRPKMLPGPDLLPLQAELRPHLPEFALELQLHAVLDAYELCLH